MITIVSGLPRSGTSMMMQMLEAGGIPPLTDGVRRADPDNPRGYYEFEPAKNLAEDSTWLHRAEGKAIKIVSMLLYDLPSAFQYKVIFMQRNLDEILASQQNMLQRKGQPLGPDKTAMRTHFHRHLAKVGRYLVKQQNMDVLRCDYDAVLRNPRSVVDELRSFLGNSLKPDLLPNVVDPSLYRQRCPQRQQ